MDKLDEIIKRTEGFNVVTAWRTPKGELIISLSHRATDDEEILVRIREDCDVILVDDAILEYSGEHPDGPWEDTSCQLGRLNKGGNWFG